MPGRTTLPPLDPPPEPPPDPPPVPPPELITRDMALELAAFPAGSMQPMSQEWVPSVNTLDVMSDERLFRTVDAALDVPSTNTEQLALDE